MTLNELLILSVQKGSSDLHISAGQPPIIRIDGDLVRLEEHPTLDPETVKKLLFEVMSPLQQKELTEQLEIDFAIEIPEVSRFRANVFHQNWGMGGVFRTIPSKIYTVEQLGLPPIMQDFTFYPNGLVLVTGPTGSGKSTTLAAVLDHTNAQLDCHILTIEDPIEYVHHSKRCLVNQREVNRDTLSFNAALRSALREDPDIILVGELRDLETIRLALTAAETGHLVFATLHTNSAAKTINRIIDVFPGDEKPMIRSMLSESLRAVVCQSLLKKVGGGRVAALEIMLCNAAIRNLIREDKIAQMYSVIQTGNSQGMQTLDQHLQELVKKQLIDKAIAKEVAVIKEMFN